MEGTINSLSMAYQSLPESIREWLASEPTMFAVGEINTRLGFKDNKRKIIPRLILRLAVEDIEPLDFVNELSYALNISFQNAKTIAQDIEEKIFREIAPELKTINVDVNLISFGQPGPKKINNESPSVQTAAEAPSPFPSVSLQETRPSTTPPQPATEQPATAFPKTELLKPTAAAEQIKKSEPAIVNPLIFQAKTEKPAEKQAASSAPANLPVAPTKPSETIPPKPAATPLMPPTPPTSFRPMPGRIVPSVPSPSKQASAEPAPAPFAAIKSETSEPAKSTAPFMPQPATPAPAEKAAEPFLIHEENTLKPVMPDFSKSSPSLKYEMDSKKFSEERAFSPKPVSVKIETGAPETAPKTNARVVNYSDFLTPMSNISSPKKPEPKKENFSKTDIPSLGNSIDLRNKNK
ncbi:MAG: hypothetical protein PHP03_02115 [Candidatus Pacebacteria bacterium]|nr:hypothetical protein [Candidatus Paceibacterota bacterium]